MTAIAEIGGGAPLVRSLFAVPGLHCAGCISKIENGLAPVPGIASARVNFTSKQVLVDHLPELQVPDLQSAIAKLGFEAQPIRAEAASAGSSESRALLKATGVAGFASMNVMLLSLCRFGPGRKGRPRTCSTRCPR
jgi:Cu2+-exporting ATPase